MTHYAKPLSFLLLIALFTSLHTEGREGKFFSKVIRKEGKPTNNYVSISEGPVLAPAPAPAPEIVAPMSSNDRAYGFYDHESSEFPPTRTTTTTIADDENEIQVEELRESYKEEETGYPYNNKGYSNNNYNTNGYTNSYNYNNNGYTNSYNYNNNGYTNSYTDRGYVTEKQGMSDTRFLENGKYFYGSGKNGKYYSTNGYESVRESDNNEGYYGNRENSNEFYSMEEYERQEGYPETQGEYVP